MGRNMLGARDTQLMRDAGHDAQEMAHPGRIEMIFPPGRRGISHPPGGYSSPEDVAAGAEVMYQTIPLPDLRP